MDTEEILQTLTALIDYFEAGNTESDAAAKAVLTADSTFNEYWWPEIERFRKSSEWTGLRGPEAEMLAGRLRQAAALITGAK